MNRDGSYSRLQIEARVDVQIDGQPAQLTAQGNQLTLMLGGRETLHRLLEGDSSLGGLVADRLAGLGLTLTVSDQSQSLLQAGHGVSSSVGRLVTGSRHISAIDLSSLVKIARGYLSTRLR